jgi:hypothetical protein
MRLPRVRFTVRRMILAVAVLAALIWGGTLWQRAVLYQWKTRFHSQMERSSVIAVIEGPNNANREELTEMSRAWANHHAALRRKYELAAARPWVYVPPDPPQPFQLSGPGRRVDLNFSE